MQRYKVKGFTLIELLVVIAIISLLASVVSVALNSARGKVRVARAVVDLRQITNVLNLYLDDNGVYPCFDHDWDDAEEINWATPYYRWPKNPWGYQYHWEHGQGMTFSISLNEIPPTEAQILDKQIDDGVATNGIIRYTGNPVRLEYFGMDQSVSLVDCHI